MWPSRPSPLEQLYRCGDVERHPGPRPKGARVPRVLDLMSVELVREDTAAAGRGARARFLVWLAEQGVPLHIRALALAPAVLASLLRAYALVLWRTGASLSELRNLITYLQRDYKDLKANLAEVWDIVTRWERVFPTRHRVPLPFTLYQAMVAISLLWGWPRFGATLSLAFQGIARIGEVLRASRSLLVLPSDNLSRKAVAYLMVEDPKTARRGGGLVQHIRVKDEQVVAHLELVFGPLSPGEPLYPGSAPNFRKCWDRILSELGVPPTSGLTPGSVRGGGAVAAYDDDIPISDIMWRMRVAQLSTLQHYLQEVAALNALGDVSPAYRTAISRAAECLPLLRLRPTGSAKEV